MGKVLVSDSLMETLWRLDEVRLGLRGGSRTETDEALDWVLSRQGLEGSYSGLFLPTQEDLKRGLQLPTGERMHTVAATKHILGEEALRTALVWKRENTPQVRQALKGLGFILDKGGKRGSYCCYTCTVAFLRTLTTTTISGKDEIVQKGLNGIRKARTPDGRWKGFPYYYTLLTLAEMNQPMARNELLHASKAARRLLERYKDKDRTARFRRLALKTALDTGQTKNTERNERSALNRVNSGPEQQGNFQSD